jgi:hypothetical protein
MEELSGYLNNRESQRPIAVWIAVILLCAIGLLLWAFIFIATYETRQVGGLDGMSLEDWVYSITIGTSGLFCFIAAILAFRRVKLSRFLPLVPMLIGFCLFAFELLEEWSYGAFADGDFILGVIAGLTLFLFPLLLATGLLFLGDAVKAYFGLIPAESHSKLPAPPPPPMFETRN